MLSKLWSCGKICREFVWPCLDYGPPEQIERTKQHTENLIKEIAVSRWKATSVALEEIRSLAAREDERRKTAETKATIYLAVLAAIVPLSATIFKDLTEYLDPLRDWQMGVLVAILMFALAYLLAAGVWTFRTIKVSGYKRVGVEHLLRVRQKEETELALCRELLRTVIENRSVVNDKVSNLLMAHAFLVRMFVVYVLLVAFPGAIAIADRFVKECGATP